MLAYWSRASGQTTVTLRVLSPAGSGEARRYELSETSPNSGLAWTTHGPLLARGLLDWSMASNNAKVLPADCRACFGLELLNLEEGSGRRVLDAAAGKISIVPTPPILDTLFVWARDCLGLYNSVCTYALTRVDSTDGATQIVALASAKYPVAVSPDRLHVAIAAANGIYVKDLPQ